MNTMRDDELQQFGDDVMQIPAISEISYELLEECVKEQILNSFFSSINYLEEFRTTYEEELEDSGNDDDAVMEVKNQAHNFYIEVLNLIDKKFGLELDSVNVYESMSGDTLRTFTEGLYEFFITNYEDNIITYITEVILDYRAAIVDEISEMMLLLYLIEVKFLTVYFQLFSLIFLLQLNMLETSKLNLKISSIILITIVSL